MLIVLEDIASYYKINVNVVPSSIKMDGGVELVAKSLKTSRIYSLEMSS